MGVFKLKKRQFFIYILLTFMFIGTVFFAFTNYNNTKDYVLESVERETDELLSNFTAEVNRFSRERIAELKLMADHIPYLLKNNDSITQFLSQQNENMPYFTGLGFINPEGEIHAADGNHFPVQQEESFEHALNGEVTFSDVFTLKQDSSQKVTAISVPIIKGDGSVVGVVSGVVNLSNLIGELVQESNLAGHVFLLKDQEVLFASNKTGSFAQVIPNSEEFLNVIDNKHMGDWKDSQDNMRFIKYQHTWNDWVVVVDSISNKATDKITETFWVNLLLALTVVVIIFIMLIYLFRLEIREKRQANKDLLTGLGNRSQLETNVIKKRKLDPRKNVTFYFIKLDRFLDMTERMGFYVSDQVLYRISKKLNQLQRKLNVYRVGDDEFVITAEFNSIEKQHEFASDIVKVIEQPVVIKKGETILLTPSIGVRTAPIKEDVSVVIQDAMYACHEAIKQGGNQYVYFTGQLAKESNQQRKLTSNLASALENDELYLLYQPIYSITDDRIVSFEALMRWKSPALGEIGPFYFIPLLEESDAIVEVGRWLIKEVAEQVLRWEKEEYDDFYVTLNVSTKQLQHGKFLADVKNILKETGVNPNRLVFEVTESIVAQNMDVAIEILETLNDLGIQTAIDDFGTGYSSLAILKKFPFQFMKLDREFVMEVLSDEGESEAILRGLIEIANSLKLTTITEGVETLDQLKVLQRLGAHRIQGYFFSKPILPEEAVLFLNKKNLLQSMV